MRVLKVNKAPKYKITDLSDKIKDFIEKEDITPEAVYQRDGLQEKILDFFAELCDKI